MCLYGLHIHFAYTRVVCLGRVFRSFRFDGELYAGFVGVCGACGCTVTGAFDRFMRGCVAAEGLVFAEAGVAGFEAEARVLVDWLCKGKYFYRSTEGGEVNVQGRLLMLLPKVQDAALRGEIEEALKKSVSKQQQTS